MTDIHTPPAALEAGANAALTAAFQIEPDARVHELTMDEYASIARAAFEAMVENWPGMNAKAATDHVMLLNSTPALILPLPEQENSDAE